MSASPTTPTRPPRSIPSQASGFHGDYARGEARAVAFLPRHVGRDEDWESRLELVQKTPPAANVWERVRAQAIEHGAHERAITNAEALAGGSAVCVTTGQQPGLFLGPLYSVYKAMTAVALARRVERKSGVPTVPVFWNAADDSDFGEIGTAFFPADDFGLTRHTLDGGDLPAGGMIGDLSIAGTRRALEEARASWEGRPSGDPLLRHVERALERGHDHGELTTVLLYDLFRDTGLVVVDGRFRELRIAASGLFRRYAEQRAQVRDAVRDAGRKLEQAGYRAHISDASTDAALFDAASGRRLAFEGTDADLIRRIDDEPESLSPNVLLRPLVQDSLFPNVATVGGPGEISYHAQLVPEYELLGVDMPILFPRFEATLVPDGVYDLAQRRGEPVEAFVHEFDATMKATAERVLPADVREALVSLETEVAARFDHTAHAAESFDPGLVGAVDQARKRALDAVAKLREKAAAAARSAETKQDPAIKRYREFLRPRGVPQERVLSALTLFLESEGHPLEGLESSLESHLESARTGEPVHWLLDFRGRRRGNA